MPLLFESGMEWLCFSTICVSCPPEVQLSRVMARDGLNKEMAEQRISAQMPLEAKIRLSTEVLDNSGPIDKIPEKARESLRRASRPRFPWITRFVTPHCRSSVLSCAFLLLSVLLLPLTIFSKKPSKVARV
eukprot:c14294_g1_i1.p1 GENE.c14294_g1_i1~~c14294_g1_i1.p1  ORF type:complete len:131 (+),score=5.71 c14294_g1_i1:415-807(+)